MKGEGNSKGKIKHTAPVHPHQIVPTQKKSLRDPPCLSKRHEYAVSVSAYDLELRGGLETYLLRLQLIL
jgi:hypothetical protein